MVTFDLTCLVGPVYSLPTMSRSSFSNAKLRTPGYEKFKAKAKATGAKVIEVIDAAAVLMEEASDERFIRALRRVREAGMQQQQPAADAA